MQSPIPVWRACLLSTLLLASLASPLAAQAAARVITQENLRKEANGTILARLVAGAPLTILTRRGAWIEVELEGWVWARSLEKTDREGFDLVVSADDGENLRDVPQGEMQAYVLEGTLLTEVERQTGWIKVRRRAWIWGASIAETGARRGAPAAPPRARAATPGPPAGFVVAGPDGAAILSAPGGDTVGSTAPRAELEVVARQGSWARVRLEGWTWMPPGDSTIGGGEPGTVTPADLRSDPQGSAGRLVSWQLQFISLERAEKVRTDFFEGEPFMLARYGGADGPFVYVAVPAERVPDLQGLVPLEIVSVTARVRTGASSLTGTPIVDLVSLERNR